MSADLISLIASLEDRRDRARRLQRTASEARLLEDVIEELRGVESGPRLLSTSQAAVRLSVEPETVARWCREGRFPGAEKTGQDGAGEWRIPAEEVDAGPRETQAPTEDRVRFTRSGECEP